MSTEPNANEMMLGLVEREHSKSLGRLCVVVDNPLWSATAQAIRNKIPTYQVTTLRELREGLSRHQQKLDGEVVEKEGRCSAFDLTAMAESSLQLFSSQLTHPSEFGTVYIVTPAQFEHFPEGSFDFVVR